jgi:hypothetical protein
MLMHRKTYIYICWLSVISKGGGNRMLYEVCCSCNKKDYVSQFKKTNHLLCAVLSRLMVGEAAVGLHRNVDAVLLTFVLGRGCGKVYIARLW